MALPPKPQAAPAKTKADEFDQGWKESSKTGLSIGKNSNSEGGIEHTFFGHEDAGLSMLVQE